jgi:predicted nuclease of predicted toxin-antitoxin system
VPEALRLVGFTVSTLDDVFGVRPVEDVEWIHYADDHNMVVACKDDRIRRRPLEKRALFYSSLRVLCLTNGHLRREQQAACFRHNIDGIVRQLRHPGPWVLGVQESRVQVLRIYPVD